MRKIAQKPSEKFITRFKELFEYQDFFILKKVTEWGKSGRSVRIVITHIRKKNLLPLPTIAQLLLTAHEIEIKIDQDLGFDFKFEYSITEYLTSTKITFVLHFKKLVDRKTPDPELYSEFKKSLEQIFSDIQIFPVFKIIQYEQLSRSIQVKFAYIPPFSDDIALKFARDTIKNGFYYNYFVKLQKIFLFNYSRLKEIISDNGIIYIYRFEVKRRKYSFSDFGICKESRHLLIKYIKMLDLVSKHLMKMHHWSNCCVYLDRGYHPKLEGLYQTIKSSNNRNAYIFLGKDKPELSECDLWIPRKRELETLLFDDEIDRYNLILLRRSKYQQWRKKHKVSIKCEELNLLVYFMEREHNLIWDKVHNIWIPKPPPPKAVFKINDYITLKLEDNQTNIYIRRRLFTHCKYLLFSFSKDELSDYEEITSIDEIQDKYDHTHEGHSKKIPPEVEFWGHCSNLQAWYEHDYDTRLLHSNLSFPLLKELAEHGDPKAKRGFKEEIALRFESNFKSVVFYLLKEKYLSYLDFNEIETLSEHLDFSKWVPISLNEFLDQWETKAIKSKDLEKVSQIKKKKMSLLKKYR